MCLTEREMRGGEREREERERELGGLKEGERHEKLKFSKGALSLIRKSTSNNLFKCVLPKIGPKFLSFRATRI